MTIKIRRLTTDVSGIQNVGNRGVLDIPYHVLLKILSSVSIPVNERVRASRTCKAFYEVLSGPQAFSDVKKLPEPNISDQQFDKILNSEKDSNTRSAMAKRLGTSVTLLCLKRLRMSSFSELLLFTHAFQNLTDLEVGHEEFGNLEEFDLSSIQVQPHKLQVSTVVVTCDQSKSFAIFLNGLNCILDFTAVRNLRVEMGYFFRKRLPNNELDLSLILPNFDLGPVLEHDFKNLWTFCLNGFVKTGQFGVLSELLMKNVESLKYVILENHGVPFIGDQMIFLSVLCQLKLEALRLFPELDLPDDYWVTDLTASSGDTLEYLAFQPETEHVLDLIDHRRFNKLTKLRLYFPFGEPPQTLTSVINFIKARPAGLPKLRLECDVHRQGNETEEQKEHLKRLISAESNAFDFDVTFHYDQVNEMIELT